MIVSNDEICYKKFGTLFQEFKSEKKLVNLIYYPILDMRRVIFTFSQINFNDYENVQKLLNLASSLIVVFYLALYRPFKENIINISNIVVESIMTFTFLIIYARGFLEILKEDEYFNMLFISVLLAELGFQYIISIVLFLIKIKGIIKKTRIANEPK